MTNIQTSIADHQPWDGFEQTRPRIDVLVDIDDRSIELGAMGYGAADSQPGLGRFAMLEMFDGKLRLIVWADINQDDPTHTIDLSNAAEANRVAAFS